MIIRMFDLCQNIIRKYRTDGLAQLFRAGTRYSIDKLLKSPIFRGELQFNLFTETRHKYHQVKYTAPANPYRPIWIDPTEINFQIYEVRHDLGLGQIKGGNWDTPENHISIYNSRVYMGLYQRFQEERNWEDTIYYKKAKKRIQEQGSICGYNDPEQYKNVRCKYVDELFSSIRDEGYRPNFNDVHEVPACDKRSRAWAWSELEPLVMIGRDGEVYLTDDGRHRFTIARILGVESIPVNVLVRHSRWQEVRDEFNNMDDLSELDPKLKDHIDHPDLQDIGIDF